MGGHVEEAEDSFIYLTVCPWAGLALDQVWERGTWVQRSAGTLSASSQTSAEADAA